MSHENEGHEQMLEIVAAGRASVLSDEQLPGGRFQVAAIIMGGEIILTTWHQDEQNDWRSTSVCLLKGDAPEKLLVLLHVAGFGATQN